MDRLRHLAFANRPFVCAIFVLALLMKLVIPVGFMPDTANGHVIVSMCSGMGPTTMVIAIPDREDGQRDSGNQHGKANQPCAFTGLSAPSLAAADPILLAAAILFVLALGIGPIWRPAARAYPFLRPPLRGPPAI